MCWRGHALYDCGAEFRLFWLSSKWAEESIDEAQDLMAKTLEAQGLLQQQAGSSSMQVEEEGASVSTVDTAGLGAASAGLTVQEMTQGPVQVVTHGSEDTDMGEGVSMGMQRDGGQGASSTEAAAAAIPSVGGKGSRPGMAGGMVIRIQPLQYKRCDMQVRY